MTNGEKLKIDLGLKNFQYVKIRRLISKTAAPIYQIFYNSRFPNRPLTVNFLNSNEFIPFVVKDDEKLYGTPFIDIERWLGEPKGKVFIATDIAGTYGRKNNYDFIYESREPNSVGNSIFLGEGVLNELITLPALYDRDTNVSKFTQKHQDIRQQFMKGANINTKLVQTKLEGNDVLFFFLTEATEGIYLPDHEYKEVVPETKEIIPNPSKTYTLILKFLNIVGNDGWIKAFDPEKEVITQKDFKEILEVSSVQIHSTDPSFLFQSFQYNLTQLDASIWPENRKPKKWDKILGGDFFLTKHLAQLFISIKSGFMLNQMASALTNVLRKNNIIPKYKKRGQ